MEELAKALETFDKNLSKAMMPQAIKDNIEYWSQNIQRLMESPPFHTTYYCVDEGGQLKIYGMKWNGADLSKGELFIPEAHDELLAGAREAIAKGHAIGDTFLMGAESPVRVVDCYVLNGIGRMIPKWLESHVSSFLRQQYMEPQTYKFSVDKKTHSVRFVNETEDNVTVLVEPK